MQHLNYIFMSFRSKFDVGISLVIEKEQARNTIYELIDLIHCSLIVIQPRKL